MDTDQSHALLRESSYRFWTSEKIRFQDVDRFDHVNNVTFAVYAESGRVEFLESVTPADLRGDTSFWVIAKLTIEFREQTHFPGEIRVGTSVVRTGRSSVTLAQGMFEGSRCVATAESIVVRVDPDTGHSLPLSQTQRRALGPYMLAQA